jgi:hypothetical protein
LRVGPAYVEEAGHVEVVDANLDASARSHAYFLTKCKLIHGAGIGEYTGRHDL